MYKTVKMSVQMSRGNTNDLPVDVGVHQRSTLSPFIFNIVMDELTISDPRRGIVFENDNVFVDETRDEVNNKLEQWRHNLESRGFKLSRLKIEYLWCRGGEKGNEEVTIDGIAIIRMKKFKYLGLFLQEK